MKKLIRTIVAAFLVCLLPAAAHAQVPGTNDPEYKELLAYRLTLATLGKVAQATRNIAQAMKNDPRVQKQQRLEAQIEKLQEKEELTDAESAQLEKLQVELEQAENRMSSGGNANTLSEMEAQMKQEPVFAEALGAAGLEPREYAKFMLAYMQAGMVAGMMKSGLIKEVPKDLTATVNMDNVKFVQDHEAELTEFAKEMEALKPPKG